MNFEKEANLRKLLLTSKAGIYLSNEDLIILLAEIDRLRTELENTKEAMEQLRGENENK